MIVRRIGGGGPLPRDGGGASSVADHPKRLDQEIEVLGVTFG